MKNNILLIILALPLLLVSFSFSPSAHAQNTFYVSTTTGSDATGDGSQGNPWATIQHGIDSTMGTQTDPVEIRVAGGTYAERIYAHCYSNLLGGFDSAGWGRNILEHETVITGTEVEYGVVILDLDTIFDGFVVSAANNTIDGIVISGPNGCGSGTMTVSRCRIENNNNGIVFGDCASAIIVNSLIIGNNTGINPSGENSADIRNCTIASNTQYGIRDKWSHAHVDIINCIIWNNGDDLYGCVASYSDISDGDPGEGNISVDPRFIDPANDDYRLHFRSPCIDSGIDTGLTEDYEGNPRPIDGNFSGQAEYDMGAYEYLPKFKVQGGDYNGDGKADIAIFRDDTGLWAVRGLGRVYFGASGDVPVSGDYDGDGTTEVAIYRPSAGLWAIRDLTRGYYGDPGSIPVPWDYDGDGKTEVAVFRPDIGLWSLRNVTSIYFGQTGDIPVPGNYGGGKWAKVAIFRPASGLWAVRNLTKLYFGRQGDTPVPADYDQDGITDIAIYRPANGLWAGILTGSGEKRLYFGAEGDIPVPANYDGDNWAELAVFRPSTGLWVVRDLTRVYYGQSGDIPVTR